MGVISHDTILSLCELLHIQPPPLVASGAGRRSVAVCVRSAPRPGAALLGRHADCVVSFDYAPRTGGAYDSHHRTAGIAGRTRRRGGGVAALAARAQQERMRRIVVLMAHPESDAKCEAVMRL